MLGVREPGKDEYGKCRAAVPREPGNVDTCRYTFVKTTSLYYTEGPLSMETADVS